MQSVEIFTQSSINCLSKTKDIFHDSVGVFHLAAYSGFAVFNVPLPVNGVVGNLGQPARTAVDAVFNCGKLWIIFDFFSFFKPQIRAVPVNYFVILPQQLFCHGDIMDIGGGDFYCVDKPAPSIHAGVALHAEMPLVSLFR